LADGYEHAELDVVYVRHRAGDDDWRQFPAGNRACPAGALKLGLVEFARVLRERRASRRLSQLDLALRAGTTQRHLSFIESGRSVPGREMVIRLGESLELPPRERNEFLLAAGFAPAGPWCQHRRTDTAAMAVTPGR